MLDDKQSRSGVAGWKNGISLVQLQRSIDIICPPPRLSPSEWAEKFVYLPDEENAEPGKFHLASRPHEIEMLDDPVDPTVREVIWMLASQAGGKTVCLIILMMYVIHQMRKSIVMVRPDIDAALNWKRDKLMPTVEATPCMAGLLADARKKDARSTTQNHRFPGGSLKLLGANSPSGFRSSSASVVLQDEVDAYRTNVEGDPCALGDRSAITFSDAWLIKSSTTTLEGQSRISTGYESGDKRKYFLPCLHCGVFQHLLTEQMKFTFAPEEHVRFDPPPPLLKLGEKRKIAVRGCGEKSFTQVVNENTWKIGEFTIVDTPQTIYVCEHCRRGWTDAQRIDAYLSGHPHNPPVMVNGQPLRAEWRATAPYTGIRSRHLNGMYTKTGLKREFTGYLHMFAEGFLKAVRGGRASLQTWYNIFKNEPFAEVTEKMEWEPLRDRAENYGPDLEPQVMAFLGGMDIQTNPARVEIGWIGFGILDECWWLDYEVISGDFDHPDVRERVWAHINSKRFNHPYLGEMKHSGFAIDYGNKAKSVLAFCKKHKWSGIFAVKGFGGTKINSLVTETKDKKGSGAGPISKLGLNVDQFKDVIFGSLRMEKPGQCFVHFPNEFVKYVDDNGKSHEFKTNFDANFYTMLCSEHRIPVRNKNGSVTYRWDLKPGHLRNEPLDIFVYAKGLYVRQKMDGIVGATWEKVKKMMAEKEKENDKDDPRPHLPMPPEAERLDPPEAPPQPQQPQLGSTLAPRPTVQPQRPKPVPGRRPMRKPFRNNKTSWMSKGMVNPLRI